MFLMTYVFQKHFVCNNVFCCHKLFSMKTFFAFLSLAFCGSAVAQTDSAVIKNIFNTELTQGQCYQVLDYLANEIGGRVSGSPQAAAAVEYMHQVMDSYGFDTVFLQPVMVPHWVRGEKEQAWFVCKGIKYPVTICALGNSIGTAAEGITAKVVEVDSWAQLDELGKKGSLKGNIVFYNRPMDQTMISTFNAYGNCVDQRWGGASKAAAYGAVGTVVRSMTLIIDDNPHTGVMGYTDSIAKVPACAISTVGAELLSNMLKQDANTTFYFHQSCQMLPDVLSYNVVGQITGSEFPNDIIVVGGHLDSWETGDGAQDDGAGCVQSLEVLRLFKNLGIKPKHTIRAVMFMNEENGGKGGAKYAELAKLNKENTIAAIESDAGGFSPRGFGFTGKDDQLKKFQTWQPLLLPYGIYDFSKGGGGSDIEHLEDQGTALIGLHPDSQRYFDLHHAATDVFSNVNKRELELGAAGMASLIYLIDEYGL